MLLAAMAATPVPTPPAPAPEPEPTREVVVAATAMQWSSPTNGAGVAYPGAAAQFQLLAPTVMIAAVAPLPLATKAERQPWHHALLHLDVLLPVIAALIVLIWLAAWAG